MPSGLTEGTRIAFTRTIAGADVDAFARLSGDANPLHLDPEFARAGGFRDRVVHGAFLVGLVSRLVGMELPVRRTTLLNLTLHFAAPTFPGETLEVAAVVESVHPGPGVVNLRLSVHCGGELRAKGSAMVRAELPA